MASSIQRRGTPAAGLLWMGMSVGAIAECLSLSPPSGSRLCQRLVRDDLVLRGAGPGHHILISLSEAGAASLTGVNKLRVAPLRSMIDR